MHKSELQNLLHTRARGPRARRAYTRAERLRAVRELAALRPRQLVGLERAPQLVAQGLRAGATTARSSSHVLVRPMCRAALLLGVGLVSHGCRWCALCVLGLKCDEMSGGGAWLDGRMRFISDSCTDKTSFQIVQ